MKTQVNGFPNLVFRLIHSYHDYLFKNLAELVYDLADSFSRGMLSRLYVKKTYIFLILAQFVFI